MTGHGADVAFPQCCTYCPYRRRFTASCTHTLRQSLLGELDRDGSCPVFSAEKTDAMRRLLEADRA